MTDPLPSLLTESEKALARRAREAVPSIDEAEPPPGDERAEEAHARRALKAVAEAGLTENFMPPLSVRKICVIREELAYASGLADVMFVMQGLGSAALALAGTEALKSRYLPEVTKGKTIAAFALTEPEAGSDIAAISTLAVKDGDDYVIDGVKTYISNAGLAGLYTLFARTGPEASGRGGLTAFAVDASAPGLRIRQRLTLSAPHPIGTVELSGCRVPATCIIGEEGAGFDLALAVLERFRPTVGAAAIGFARRAMDESVRRARERRQFGRPLAEFQATRFKLADMAARLEASRLLVLQAASLLDAKIADRRATRRASAMAKLFATETAQSIVDEAVQIHGGLGVTRGHIVERLYREVRALRIYEGTSEIQRAIIAGTLLRET